MNGPILGMSDLGLLVGATIFVVLYVVTNAALKSQLQGLPETARRILAVCVPLLAVLGMFHFVSAPADTPSSRPHEKSAVGFILLPYAAMGISILLILLFLFFRRFLGGDRESHRGDSSPTSRREELDDSSTDTEAEDLPEKDETSRWQGEVDEGRE